MNKQLLGLLGSGMIALAANASPVVIYDEYVGGTGAWGSTNGGSDPNHPELSEDAIGVDAVFDTHSMTITQSGSMFNFDIHTNFVGKQGTSSTVNGQTVNYGKYIGYGDLFLGSVWEPDGDASDGYASDEAFSTLWTYALVLDNREGTGGDLLLYKMLESSDSTVLLSNDYMEPTSNGYRQNQEVALDLSAEDTGKIFNTQRVGSWTEDLTSSLLKMDIDLYGTGLLDSNTLAFHWTMYCANDVIQGQADITPYRVPEPGVFSLLSLGLVGLWFARRRQQKLVA
ncbi:MAG: PEP-CTERM sorting domain-containing protein [Saccharospirillum sp.]|nr:PEP-CTERM sorting domain-containing protein [Saccharospirillum sp.]